SLWTIYLLTRVFPHGNYCITAMRSVRAEGKHRGPGSGPGLCIGESTRDALIARLARDPSVESSESLRRPLEWNCLRAVTARWKCDNAVPYILLLARGGAST